jgi:tRNA modification GTPase
MTSKDTIYALSSGAGIAGIAVIRVSGPATRAIVSGLCGRLPRERYASLSTLRHPAGGDVIDRGIVLWLPGPGSFTGEDSAEFQVHGSRAVVDALFKAIGSFAHVRTAEPGEFTLRAFHNGRLNLMEVEGLSDLIGARTESQRRQAVQQSGGMVRATIEGWRQELLQLLARAEAAVDFIDEAGVSEAAQAEIGSRLSILIPKIEAALAGAAKGRAIREGIKVVIAGPPNAGKSSLLNFLAGRDAAIVSAHPGTTRDAIEVSFDMEGLPVIFTDTAGLREETQDEIERIGMARSWREVGEAEIVVWLTEPDSPPPPQAIIDSRPIWVENKCDLDLRLFRNDPHYRVSVRTGEGMTAFLNGLRQRIAEEYGANEPAMIVRARQRECVEVLLECLKSAKNQHFSVIELQAEDLRAAADALGRLVGKINVEDVLGEIFDEFCIGK